MKISQIQDHLAAAGYLNLDIVKAKEDGVWGPYTAAAYEQAVREILHPFMSHNDLEYVSTHQPESYLDSKFVTALEEKAEKLGNALRKQTKAEAKPREVVKKQRAAKAKTVQKTQPKKASNKQTKQAHAPSIVTDKRIM